MSAVRGDQVLHWRLVRALPARQELQPILLQRVRQGARQGTQNQTKEVSEVSQQLKCWHAEKTEVN